MKINNFEINLLVKGRPVVEYTQNGKVFVEGREGSEFEIEFVNRTSGRVEAIFSVDGKSVTDGKDAGVNSSGYLVEGHGRLVIPGWKLNDEEVAKFFFAGKQRSYSTQMSGSSANNGVIGLMVFSEKARQPVFQAQPFRSVYPTVTFGGSTTTSAVNPGSHLWYSGSDATTGSGLDADLLDGQHGAFYMNAATSLTTSNATIGSTARSKSIQPETVQLNQLGTGFGRAEEFHTEVVQFDRGDLAARMVVYYDNARGLRARGIEVGRKSRTRYTAGEPQAFPGMGCTPPPGWRA